MNEEEITEILDKLLNRKQETLLQGLRECQLKNIEHVFITRKEYIDKVLNYLNDLQQANQELKKQLEELEKENQKYKEVIDKLNVKLNQYKNDLKAYQKQDTINHRAIAIAIIEMKIRVFEDILKEVE